MNKGYHEEILFTADNIDIFNCVKNIILTILENSIEISRIKISQIPDTAFNIKIEYYRKVGDSWKDTIDKANR